MDIPVGLFPLCSGRLFRADDATIHAGWEILLWLNGWKGEKDTKLETFTPLSYPYYLFLNDDGSHKDEEDISVRALAANANKTEKDYQKSLIEFSVYAAPKDGSDFVAGYQKKTAVWKDPQKREYINGLIRSWWEKMSGVKASQSVYCAFCHPFHLVFANYPSKRVPRIKYFTSECPPTEWVIERIERMSSNNPGETFHTQESLKV
jgi:hypothetical protein